MKNKKILIISLVSLVVIALGAILAYKFLSQGQDPSNSVPPDSNFVEDKNQPLTDGNTPNQDKVITPDQSGSDSSPGEQPEKPSITRAEQSGSNIRVSAILTNASSGTCLLTLRKNGAADITKTVPITVGPSYYTCNGFLVPRSEIPSGGEWQATVTHQLNGKSTTSDTKTITVQ